MTNVSTFRYPEVVITDIPAGTPSDGTNTPAGDADDDFFSSWDKPSIKRPSNPPSRTGTPPVVSRTGSPLLNVGANANGSRSKSPLSASEEKSTSPAPTAIRPTAAARKTTTSSTAKKGSLLGAKKAPKLGAKKVAAADLIDFDEAERKAKEEAERIEKLGYDPEAEQAEAEAKKAATAAAAVPIAAPTPVSPAGKSHERNSSDVDRLGMGMNRLGFGQVTKPPAPKKPAFGSVGPAKPNPADGISTKPYTLHRFDRLILAIDAELAQTRTRFGTQKGISSDEFFGRDRFDPAAQSEAKDRLRQFDSATSISSNTYFGRPEDEVHALDDGYGDMEATAKDFIRQFGITAGDDLENLSHLVGEGATKLQGEHYLQHEDDYPSFVLTESSRRYPHLSEQLGFLLALTHRTLRFLSTLSWNSLSHLVLEFSIPPHARISSLLDNILRLDNHCDLRSKNLGSHIVAIWRAIASLSFALHSSTAT